MPAKKPPAPKGAAHNVAKPARPAPRTAAGNQAASAGNQPGPAARPAKPAAPGPELTVIAADSTLGRPGPPPPPEEPPPRDAPPTGGPAVEGDMLAKVVVPAKPHNR